MRIHFSHQLWLLFIASIASGGSWAIQSADSVLDWNTAIGEVIRDDTTLPGPVYASRTYMMVHAAIYDAVNSISREHEPYILDVTAPLGTSADAAVGQAAHDVLVSLYPDQAGALSIQLTTFLSGIPPGPGKNDGILLGQAAAEAIIEARAFDHAYDTVAHPDGTLPGEWRRTPPTFGEPLGTQWPMVTPACLRSGAQMRPPGPPGLASPEYTAAYNEVKAYGKIDSASRTAEQTEIGLFWAYDRGGLGPPLILYNQIAQYVAQANGNSLAQNAHLFALVNLAMADAAVACWECKYHFNLWRPITGIQLGDTDGNPDTVGDPAWLPLGAPGGGVVPDFTPPFPAYTSGHATFCAASLKMLANYYGGDTMDISLTSDEIPGVTRTFGSFSEAIEENGQSRIYLGIHWSFDKVLGIQNGNQIADYVFKHLLRPVHDADVDKDGKVGPEDLILLQEKWQQ
jgi:hypothetical protein